MRQFFVLQCLEILATVTAVDSQSGFSGDVREGLKASESCSSSGGASKTTSASMSTIPSAASSSPVAVSWPAPSYCSNYSPFPTMYYGMDMTEFRIKESAWNTDIQNQTINLTTISSCMPQLDMVENMKIANVTGYPNQGKPFPVTGLDIDRVIWFTEVENRKRTDPVVLFFHGGGLYAPILASHSAGIDQLYKTLPLTRLSWLSVDYTLTMYKKYPQQLREFAAVYTKLLETTDNIILVTDSSGAHEALELLIHMQNPFVTVDPVPANNATKAILMSSPWTDNGGYYDILWAYNAGTDFSGPWWQNVTHIPSEDKNIHWNKVLPPKTFIVYGENDTVVDQAQSLKQNANLPDENVYIEPNGTHDEWIILGNQTVTNHIAKFLESIILS